MNRRDLLKILGAGAVAVTAFPLDFTPPPGRIEYFHAGDRAWIVIPAPRYVDTGDYVVAGPSPGRILGVAMHEAKKGQRLAVQVYGPSK